MKTDTDLERQLRDLLRQTLDREVSPDPTWAESPAARRVAEQEGRRPRRWTIRLLAIAALITIGGGAALLLGPPVDVAGGVNGWIAFAMNPEDGGDQDIWFVSLEGEPRRVVGTDTDGVDQFCPAFSPDGRSLAYGQVDPSETPATAVVVAAVTSTGEVSEVFRVRVGGAPPCPVWSPDGDRIAFGVPLTSVGNPTQSAAGSEVWILRVADRVITVLPDLLATDLEFSPDGSVLGIASGMEYDGNYGEALADGRIHLYELASGATRTLEGTLGATSFTWSPDGERIAYHTGDSEHGLLLIDLATEEQRALAETFEAIHGIGPVWSPDGESIVYQRGTSGERHDVVLVWPDDLAVDGAPREEVVPLFYRSANGSDLALYPYWVDWSPDGEYLLFAAWSSEIDPLLGVVPLTSGSHADLLVTDQDLTINPVYEWGPNMPIQTWGRLPAGTVMPSETPQPSVPPTPTPVSSPGVGLPAGSHLISEGIDGGVPITVTVSTPLWSGEPNGGSLCWGDPATPCADPSGGVGLLAFEGREYSVYREACTWASTRPESPATTLDELIDALANQGSRAEGALGPAEAITVDGYTGTRIFLPMHPVDMTTCDEGYVAMFGLPGMDPARYTERQDLIEEVWAVDVNGLLLVLDATYFAETPPETVDELRTILASARFEQNR